MKKALVVDWLDKYGGAEKVIQTLEECFIFDEVYALVNVMEATEKNKIFPRHQNIQTTFLQIFGSKFRFFFPLFFRSIKRIKISTDVNLIISSSHSVAKGIGKTNSNQLHISYFQAPNCNYIWQDAPLYFKSLYPIVKPFLRYFRKKDYEQAQQPDFIICNSVYVQKWISNHYQRDAVVIYPPVNLSAFPLHTLKSDYYIIAGRIATIKRFDVVIDAFNKNNKKLLVIGDGDELAALKNRTISSNIKFLGFQEKENLSAYLQKAKAFIQMGVEGFGIAALEAQSCGTPVIAFKAGGVLETVVEHKTGLFFNEQTMDDLNKCIDQFEKITWNYTEIHQHAQQFSEENFKENILSFVNLHLK